MRARDKAGDYTEAKQVEGDADKVIDAEPKSLMPVSAVSGKLGKAPLKQSKNCQFHDEADVSTYVKERVFSLNKHH